MSKKEKRVKICFVTPKAYPLFHPKTEVSFGGAERQVYLLAKELVKHKTIDVNFCVADFSQKDIEIYEHDIKVWKSFRFREFPFLSFFKLYRTLRKIDADYYIFRTASFGVAVLFYTLKVFLPEKKLIYMVAHDDESYFKTLKKKIGLCSALLFRPVYKLCDVLVVQSQFEKMAFLTQRKKELFLINKIQPIEIPVREIEMKKKKEILWIGRPQHWKRPEIFLELARKYPKENFTMILTASDNLSYWNALKAEAEKIKNLQFLEWVKPNEIHEYYRKAKLYVITSTNETFSHTMMESCETMTPILSLNVNTDDIITKHELGLFSGDDLTLFYEQFEKLVGDENLRKKLGKNARQYLEKHHGPEQSVEVFLSLLKTKKI